MRIRSRVAVVALAAAGFVPAASTARMNAVPRQCSKMFTLRMFERAARRAYTGAQLPARGAYGHLWRYARCQREPENSVRARALWGAEIAAWAQRRAPPAYSSLASWYDDAGSTACGFHAYIGVANRTLACGTQVEICYHGCTLATVDDRGPYVYPREWDLNQNTAGAVGFSGVGDVRWRIT